MGKMLIGLVIALLDDFNITFAGNRVLDLAPDVLGYIFIILGMRGFGRYSHKFVTAYKVAHFAAVAAGAVLLTSLVIGRDAMSMVIVLMGIAAMILEVIMLYSLANGFSDMERDMEINMQSKWLKITAIAIAPGILMVYASAIPVLRPLELVGNLILDISSFAYLILFYFAREDFKIWKADQTEE